MLLAISLVFFIGSIIGLTVIVRGNRDIFDATQADATRSTALKNKETKKALLEGRIKRKFSGSFTSVKKTFSPTTATVAEYAQKGYKRLREKEQMYRTLIEQRAHLQKKEPVQADVQEEEEDDFLEEVAQEVQEESMNMPDQFADQETKLLEMVAQDPKNETAYVSLGALYREHNRFSEMVEVFEYLASMKSNNVDYFLEWAQGLCEIREYENVYMVLERSLVLGFDDENIVDKIMDMAILGEDKLHSRRLLKQLINLNPENTKIEIYKEQIDEIR